LATAAASLATTLLAGTAAAQSTMVIAAVTTPKGFDGDVYLLGMVENVINVYKGLTDYGRTKGPDGRDAIDAANMVPLPAESWTVTPDGKTYTFKLRKAKSFFGNELRPEDILFSWEKSESQKLTGNSMKGVTTLDKVEKVSDSEVRFSLKAPNRSFLKVLQLYVPSVYDSRKVREFVAADDPFATKWIGSNTAGYGSYLVESVRPGEGSTLVVNPNYFGKKPFFDRVVYREVPSPSNRAALVKTGAAHWAEQVPINAIPDLMKDRSVKVQSVVGTGSAVLWMNANFKPFDDVRVRRAMALAADQDSINKTVFLGLGTQSKSFLPQMMPGYQASYPYGTDYGRAKALLAEAGHPNGIDVTLEYSDLYWWEEGLVIQYVQSARNAGIRVTPKRIPSTELRTRAGPGQRTLPFHTGTTIPFVLDPSYAFYLAMHTGGSSNVSNYKSATMDATIEKMVMEQDDAKWRALINEAQKEYADNVLAVETFFPGFYAVMAPCIQGWVWRPVPHVYFRDLSCQRS
jgi:ABC-type transport system substrate-binding protein